MQLLQIIQRNLCFNSVWRRRKKKNRNKTEEKETAKSIHIKASHAYKELRMNISYLYHTSQSTGVTPCNFYTVVNLSVYLKDGQENVEEKEKSVNFVYQNIVRKE